MGHRVHKAMTMLKTILPSLPRAAKISVNVSWGWSNRRLFRSLSSERCIGKDSTIKSWDAVETDGLQSLCE